MRKHTLINPSFLRFIATGAIAVLLASCAPKGGGAPGADTTGVAPSAERGKYLVTVVGCNDCHTPLKMGPQGPGPDMTRMLSGHPASMPISAPAMVQPPWMVGLNMTMTAYSGPWGVSFSANLTPDSTTGLGAWSLATFDSAIRTGKHMGTGRPILPPMPWPWFKQMTDNDLASIYAYLRTIPPISNKVPDPIMPNPTMPPGMGGPPPGAPPLPPGAMPPPRVPPVAPPPPPPPPHHAKHK